MPSSRRLKVTGLVAFLTVCIIFYVTNGARSTHDSAFYTRTVASIKDRQDNEARKNVLAEERERLERLKQVEREHNVAVAVSAAAPKETKALNVGPNQKPIIPESTSKSGAGGKSVAGRKMMNDGKVVHGAPTEDDEDGVAKVGNIGPQSTHAVVGDKEESEEDHKVQHALNEILKKGPIIIFSKTFCPFSKKAKVSSIRLRFCRSTSANHYVTAHSSRPLRHYAAAVRRGTRPARVGTRPAVNARTHDWPSNRT